MWMKQVPHCTFSSFDSNRGGFHDKKSVVEDFQAVPNYKLASSGFDAQHLDRFISRVNVADSINFSSSEQALTAERHSVATPRMHSGHNTARNNEGPIVEEDMVVTNNEYGSGQITTPNYANIRMSAAFRGP